MTIRTLQRAIEAIPTSDGAGVKLQRSLGQSQAARLDPFLMLDHFSTDNADDYIAGFPAHPHRGFETVTYMLDGHMRHEDHLGHRGELTSGGVQWMTAGRGIIHSEMPQQDSGRMRGFQLWINLPAKDKMKKAGYQDLQASEIPERPPRRSRLIQVQRLQSTISSSRLLSELLSWCDRLRLSCFIPPSAAAAIRPRLIISIVDAAPTL